MSFSEKAYCRWILIFPILLFTQPALIAANTTSQVRNFLDFPQDSPFFPVLMLIGIFIAMFTFFKPRFGLMVALFFMLISTDMQLQETGETGYGDRAVTVRLEDIILLLVSGGWLLNRAKTRSLSFFRNVPVNKPIMIMAFAIVIATIAGYLQGTTPFTRGVFFTMKRLQYFWIFFMTLNILEPGKDVRKCIKILLVLSGVIATVGIIQFFMFPLSELTGGGATATSGFGRANTLAAFILIATGIFLGLSIYTRDRKKTLLYLAVLALCISLLVMTKSRGAYVSVPPLLAIIIYLSKSRKTMIYLLLCAVVYSMYLLFMMLVSAPQTGKTGRGAEILAQKHTGDIGNQFESISDVATKGPGADSSFNARYRGWINAIPDIFSRPILGHGVGSIPLATFDCQYVRELYETGFVGLMAFLYMNFAIFITVLNLFRISSDPFTKGLSCGWLGAHAATMVHGVSIANFYTIMNMEIFWFVLALIMLLYHEQMSSLSKQNQQSYGVIIKPPVIPDTGQPEA